MKVEAKDFLKSQRKTGLQSFVKLKMADDAVNAKDPEKDETPKTFVLSPTGGEIHRGESVVDRLTKPETLREKIARFERLSARVRQNREYLASLGGEIFDPNEDEDDFDFDDGEIRDDFGDIVEFPVIKPVETGVSESEESPAINSQGDEKQSEEPVSES